MEEKTKRYLFVGLGTAAYYLYAKDQFKPIKGSERFLISPAFGRSTSPMMRVLSALVVYQSLRDLGVSQDTAPAIVAAGVFGMEWYLRAYTTKLVAVPKTVHPSAAVETAAPAAPVATGWEPWDNWDRWSRFGTLGDATPLSPQSKARPPVTYTPTYMPSTVSPVTYTPMYMPGTATHDDFGPGF